VLNQFKEQIEADLGVTLSIEEIPNEELQATFVTASQQGAGPDVTVGAHDWIGNAGVHRRRHRPAVRRRADLLRSRRR
jgi:maltose-binding protein MalE